MKLERREHHGVMLPVPWVTLWTEEEAAKPAFFPFRTRLGGITVRVEPTLIGQGEPEWARVHTGRAILSVRKGICQVCGEQAPTFFRFGSGPEFGGFTPHAGAQVAVTEPATCEDCIPRAEKLCPNVRDEGPWSWWFCEILGVVGGNFGPPIGRDAQPIMLTERKPPPGWVMKQPFTGVILVKESGR